MNGARIGVVIVCLLVLSPLALRGQEATNLTTAKKPVRVADGSALPFPLHEADCRRFWWHTVPPRVISWAQRIKSDKTPRSQSHHVNVYQAVVEIIPNVSGEVLEVPVRPSEQAAKMLPADLEAAQATVAQCEAGSVEAEQQAEALKLTLAAAQASVAKLQSQMELAELHLPLTNLTVRERTSPWPSPPLPQGDCAQRPNLDYSPRAWRRT